MKKILTIIVFGIINIFITYSQNKLYFNNDGKFKIIQFTDIHYIHNDPRSFTALENIKNVLSIEKPDLIIITGDIIFGKPAAESFKDVLNTINSFDIPFAFTFGNHDNEHELSNNKLYQISKYYKNNITGDYESSSDYVLKIYSSKDSKKCSGILYCMDSHSYAQDKNIGGYAWFTLQQLNWYRNVSNDIKTEEKSNLPALAFFHIPLPEFKYALYENAPLIGTYLEKVCSPELNTGLFATMRLQGDIMGIFVGHDHDNDFAVYYKNILLCYGRYSGGNTVYNHLPNGARVIEMYNGTRSFKSWIRLNNGQKQNEIFYPDSFLKK